MHPLNETTAFNLLIGEVAEWSIAPVLKTDVLKGTGGSNPSLSAEKQISLRSLLFYLHFSTAQLVENQFKMAQRKILRDFKIKHII